MYCSPSLFPLYPKPKPSPPMNINSTKKIFSYPLAFGDLARNMCEALLSEGYECDFKTTPEGFFIIAIKADDHE